MDFYSICKGVKDIRFLHDCEKLKELCEAFYSGHSKQIKIFVEALECFYPYDDSKYFEALRIKKNSSKFDSDESLRKEDVEKLIEWKFNNRLGENSKQRIEGILELTKDMCNWRKNNTDISEILNQLEQKLNFIGEAPVVKTFLLHIVNPAAYPLFDRYVWQAYCFIKKKKAGELTIKKYKENYIGFFKELKNKDINSRSLDRTLWTFGKEVEICNKRQKNDRKK